VDFKLENVLVSLHSLKTMVLGPFGASAPLFLRNGELPRIVYAYVCMHMHVYVCMYMYVYVCMYMYVYVCMYMYVYVCMYMYVYMCMYMYVYAYLRI
jgi:hypothetical protein